jgi:hypothetical protein
MNGAFNLALLYYKTNQKRKQALGYAYACYDYLKNDVNSVSLFIYEMWNGIFENVDDKIERILKLTNYQGLGYFLTNLLYQEQKNLVLSLFESETHGNALKTRYELLYYATLILMNKTEGNLLLKIPPEVLPTVEAIVADVKEKQAFYAQTAD